MPRRARVHVPGGLYHLTLRGNHRESLFGCGADRDVLSDIVSQVIAKLGARVHGFCWMHNHLHFVMQVSAAPTGKVMQRIAMRYSRYRHRQMFLTGHLFERRYWAKLVEDDVYFMELLRYVHLNPVAAGIVSDPAEYRWSSHRNYLGREAIAWLTTELGLGLFGDDVESARAEYCRFMAEPVDEDGRRRRPDGTGLAFAFCDSQGTAAAVTPCVEQPPISLDELARQISGEHGVGLEALCSRSRSRMLSPARAAFASVAIDRGMASLKAVADFLGRHPSVVLRLIERHRVRLQGRVWTCPQ